MTQARKEPPKLDCSFLHTMTEERQRVVHKEWRVLCPMCKFSGPWCVTERDAIEAVTGRFERKSPLS